MKYKFLLLSIFVLAAQISFSQQLRENQNLEKFFQNQYHADSLKGRQLEKQGKIKFRSVTNGKIIEFSGFDETGQPLFTETHNVGAGRSISTNKVWPEGINGTSLTGAGIQGSNRVGVWDGGAVRLAHQEFGGRVTQGDGATGADEHATHVSGTMVGAGVSANAKGMAYEANLRAYTFSNDNAEMTAAASGGMLISNHSYGTITGWHQDGGQWYWYGNTTVSETEDYKFGFYDSKAQSWDQIAMNNPYYLICKSAGNNRNTSRSGSHFVMNSNGQWVSSTTPRGPDGPYNSVSTYGTSKNILTVGAVSKIGGGNTNNGYVNAAGVSMSSFSDWGPTDDGRIKPDVVGVGVNLLSATSSSNTAYNTLSGTSMSTPNVSGSLVLVQEHYLNLYNAYLRSSTLKGLIIHTADEAGENPGPDYSFGWGLVNISKAVAHISDSNNRQILEQSLANNATYTREFTTNGAEALKVTICWTDRPGTPPAVSLNPTNLMLVNDLDIRITRVSDNTVFYPYILDPSNPSAAATTGDNFRDNVEQISIAVPEPGDYILTITHKGNLFLSQAQNYSLIISGASAAKPNTEFEASKTLVCVGEPVDFTDLSENGPATWEWTFEGATPSTSNVKNPSGIVYNTEGTYEVKLKCTNLSGEDSTLKTNYITVVTQPAKPEISTDFIGDSFCNDTSIVLVSSADNNNQWYRNGNLIANATNKTYSVSSSGTYAVRVSNQIHCLSELSETKTYTIYGKPFKPFVQGNTTPTVDTPTTYSVNLNNGSSYLWTTDGIIVSGQTTNSVKIIWDTEGAGEVRLTETGSTGCESDETVFAVTVSNGVGINKTGLQELNVYPNPASDLVNISFYSKESDQIKISINNLLGQKLLSTKYSVSQGNFNTKLEVQNLEKGVYLLSIEGKQGIEIRKIQIK